MKKLLLIFLLILLSVATFGQETTADIKQNPVINNLKHPDWYIPAKLGSLGGVSKIGSGKEVLVLLTGMGFEHSIFTEFMMRNYDRYTMYAFTPAGHGSSIAPPIPEKHEYEKRIWSKAFENSVVDRLKKEGVKKFHVLGFFSQGIQHAIHLTNTNPEMVEKLILVGGELVRDFGRKLSPEARAKAINENMSVKWFKTITPKTWYNGMFKAKIYSADEIRSQRYWEIPNQPTISTLVQYLNEFMADDPTETLKTYKKPVLVTVPGFDEDFDKLENSKRLRYWFNDSWKKIAEGQENITLKEIENSRIFIFDDQPAKFDKVLSKFINK